MVNLQEEPKAAYDSLEDHLPAVGFLGAYLKFTSGVEVCPRFRFFSACSVMGAIINNHIWIQRGDEGFVQQFHRLAGDLVGFVLDALDVAFAQGQFPHIAHQRFELDRP